MSYLFTLPYRHALDIVHAGYIRYQRERAEHVYWFARQNGINSKYDTFDAFWQSTQQPKDTRNAVEIMEDVKTILDDFRG